MSSKVFGLARLYDYRSTLHPIPGAGSRKHLGEINMKTWQNQKKYIILLVLLLGLLAPAGTQLARHLAAEQPVPVAVNWNARPASNFTDLG
jgi:hypothetical protein